MTKEEILDRLFDVNYIPYMNEILLAMQEYADQEVKKAILKESIKNYLNLPEKY